VKIREAQRDAFAAQAAEIFPERLRALLAQHLPERSEELEGEEGLARVRVAGEEARARGYVGERDAARWVALGWVLGPGFAEEPWAAKILADEGHATPTERIEALWAAAEDHEIDEAARATAKALS
jgi:hypothetical protein